MTDRLDTLGMWASTHQMPDQILAALEQSEGLRGLPERSAISNVLVLGMGPGGFAGDLLAVTAGPFMPVPIVVVKSYQPPSYVDEQTLVFALSASGNTPETIQAVNQAAAAGGRVVAVTGDGELSQMAARWDVPVVEVPPNLFPTRSTLSVLAVAPMVILELMGLFPGASEWVREGAAQLCRRRDIVEAPAKDLARVLGPTVPLVYGGGGLGSTAARHWKHMINISAKAPAFSAGVPDILHNEIAGWGQHGDLTRQVFSLVLLRHDHEHPDVMAGFDILLDLMDEVVGSTHEVRAGGEGPVAQVFDLMYQGSITALEMAAAVGLDPGPAPAIELVRKGLQ
ncbi:MAG: SIS domain-containing protein [Acidimicrobiia bacterium]|nr:SIS domain-containing protein [Acidimicrobiia bacterium]MYC57434.1 SIS domain-containing protein [Acidimicrobiia bacterium]MYG93745.1 SIS domain-containing protein [Acidimicrobiia bacterium]MYI30669.1 SIS domain-containing protein [Acidimicrobiia bacterium]